MMRCNCNISRSRRRTHLASCPIAAVEREYNNLKKQYLGPTGWCCNAKTADRALHLYSIIKKNLRA